MPSIPTKKPLLFKLLTSEVNPSSLLFSIALLVALIHFLIAIWLLASEDTVKLVRPEQLVAVVVLIDPPTTKIAQPSQVTTNAIPAQKPHQKTTVAKKIVNLPKALATAKSSPIVHKQGDSKKTAAKPIVRVLSVPLPSVAQIPKSIETAQMPSPAEPTQTTVSNPVAHTSGIGQDSNSGVVELGCKKPTYPARALERGIEGGATAELTINEHGEVANAKIIKSEPEDVFDAVALYSAETCRFKPRIINGVAVSQRAVKHFAFKLPRS